MSGERSEGGARTRGVSRNAAGFLNSLSGHICVSIRRAVWGPVCVTAALAVLLGIVAVASGGSSGVALASDDSSRAAAPLANDVSRNSIIGVEPIWQELSLYGQGQVIAVADTGLDTGDSATLSDDFAGRLAAAYAWGRPGDWSDPNGHGTHVAGSVLGSGRLSGSNPDNNEYQRSFSGTAPEAQLVVQSLIDGEGGLGGLPDNLGDLLQQAYDTGARIHSNSWGANFFIKPLARFLTAGQYNLAAVQVDGFLWEHPDMVVLFAAGNEGVDLFTPGAEGEIELPFPDGVVDPTSMASPGTAKNVITVGASEGLRSEGGHAQERWGAEGDLLSSLMGDSYPAEPLASDLPSDHAEGMAAFSSRGPANDGRIKPDVVAPGTNIISARSHDDRASDLFGVYDDHYVYCSGTSMATPLVAGGVALIRQWYVDIHGKADPSAALIKATLINGATDISPGQFGPGTTQDVPQEWPNSVTGWGRVNIKDSISPGSEREVWFLDRKDGLNTGDEAVVTRWAAASGEPLRVALVWTDAPGEMEPVRFNLPGISERPPSVLVNDLDLTVTSPDGRTFHGNMGAGPDRLNNVEAIRISDPPEGEYSVVVRAHQVPQGPQPFAVVVAGQRIVSGPAEAEEPAAAVPETEAESDSDGDGFLPTVIVVGVLVAAVCGVLAYVLVTRRQAMAGTPAADFPAGQSIGGQAMSIPGTSLGATGSRASLYAEQGPLTGQRLPVDRSPFTIGRAVGNALVVPDVPVSRQHAQLEEREERWYLTDLGSSNGTFLNRQQVTVSQPLHEGDMIGLGESLFRFAVEAGPPAVAAEAVAGAAAGPASAGEKSNKTLIIVAAAAAVALVILVVAAIAIVSGGSEDDAATDTPMVPGLEVPTGGIPTGIPPIDIPTGIPSVEIPTGIPSLEIPTEMPTGVPSLEIPTGMPTGLPIPTGGIELPELPIPAAAEAVP